MMWLVAKHNPDNRKLVIGPAIAILNSCMARSGSRAIRARPPKTKSVMEITGMR